MTLLAALKRSFCYMHDDHDDTLEEARKRPGYRAGDYILNRYMPNATYEEREAARQHLQEFVAFLYGVRD